MKNICLTILFLNCFFLQGIAQSVSISNAPTSLCPNESISFQYSQTGLVEPVACVWDFGDGIISTVCSPSHTFPSSATYTVCITVTDANNTQAQDCTDITVLDDITPSLIVSNPSCTGGFDGSIVYNPISSNYTFEWSNGQIGSQIFGLNAGVYGVTITDISGCQVEEYIEINIHRLYYYFSHL